MIKEYSFSPRISKLSNVIAKLTMTNDESTIDRLSRLDDERRLNLRKQIRLKIEEEMKECTFKPDVKHSSGFRNYIKRNQSEKRICVL